jgi:hypothetical protein
MGALSPLGNFVMKYEVKYEYESEKNLELFAQGAGQENYKFIMSVDYAICHERPHEVVYIVIASYIIIQEGKNKEKVSSHSKIKTISKDTSVVISMKSEF